MISFGWYKFCDKKIKLEADLKLAEVKDVKNLFEHFFLSVNYLNVKHNTTIL